jgi:predicted dehydrogenase
VVSRDETAEWGTENRPTIVATVAAFVESLRQGRPMPITGLDGQRAVEIADACYESALTGRWTPVRNT